MTTAPTVAKLLDELASRNDNASDYRLAKILGVTRASTCHYRAGRTLPDDAVCIRLAAALNVSPGFVLAVVAAERTRNEPARRAWRDVARALSGRAAALAAAVIGAGMIGAAPAPSHAAEKPASLYIMSNRKRRKIKDIASSGRLIACAVADAWRSSARVLACL